MTVTALKTGDNAIRDTRRNVLAATALLLAAATFVVAEAVTAAAWDHPAYSYANDFVSDLGVPGPPQCSRDTLSTPAGPSAQHRLHRQRGAGRDRSSPAAAASRARSAGTLAVSARHRIWPRAAHRLPIPRGAELDAALARPRRNADHRRRQHRRVPDRQAEQARLGLPSWLARVFTGLGAVGFAFFLIVQVLVVVDSAVLPHNIGTLERVAIIRCCSRSSPPG